MFGLEEWTSCLTRQGTGMMDRAQDDHQEVSNRVSEIHVEMIAQNLWNETNRKKSADEQLYRSDIADENW